MAKVCVDEMVRVLFQTALSVRVGDVNYGGHLANDAVLALCHEVRVRWLAASGWTETDAGGAGLIMADAAAVYLRQGRCGDRIDAVLGVSDVGRAGFTLVYELCLAGGVLLARVQTGMVCFDYGKQKVCRLPDVLRAALSEEV